MSKKPTHCEICDRAPGDRALDRGHWPDPGQKDTPLGALEKCADCRCWVCPDCLHERDCCELHRDGGLFA